MISDSRPKPVQTPPIKSSAHNEPHPSAFFYVIVQIQMNLCYAMEFDEIVMVELNVFQIRERKKKNPGLPFFPGPTFFPGHSSLVSHSLWDRQETKRVGRFVLVEYGPSNNLPSVSIR